ncbi:hypothetical protein [Shinella sp.]|uniref:hypothetical protein n=1 Tax=Shinella sp. TaxID=1870904 RepID=UPI00258E03F3|nr:hypothetical protein [Shinella sp.]MCW5706745.1 hypothetical protein [Shinella sp.]
MTAIQRNQIEKAIDVLIALLDAADGDPDIEGDEREDETDHDLNEPYAGCHADYSEEAAQWLNS